MAGLRLAPITLTAPGSRGLNKERQNSLLGPEWARDGLNSVLNREGRMAARKGWTSQTSGAISGTPKIRQLFEYMKGDGTVTIITTANNHIYKDFSDYTVGANDITPGTPPTADAWQFVNLADKVYGVQAAHTMISWSGTGSFANVVASSGVLPAGNAACAAFGRLWVIDSDNQTLKYSALLDGTKWAVSDGGGSVALQNVWTKGMDQGIAVAAFGSNLVVFGKNHIIMYADGSGSTLGIDPTQMYVVDTIEGTGCIARDTIQAVGEGDLAFLSRHGIQLLGRVVADKSNPSTTISKNIRTYLSQLVATQTGASLANARSAHSPENGIYILLLPDALRAIVADTRFGFQDDDGTPVLPMLEWTYTTMPTALCVRANGDVLLGLAGKVGLYASNIDGSDTYDFVYSSPWLRIDDEETAALLKMLKEIPTIIQINATANLSWNWEFDFNGNIYSGIVSYTLNNTGAEYSIAEYSIDEYSGGLTLQAKTIDGQGEGQFFRIGCQVPISGFDFALQQIKMIFALGRMAA